MRAGSRKIHRAACSSLISSCERNGKLEQAVGIADSMHSTGLYHSPDLYVKLIEALGRQQHWELALELFLSMQVSHPSGTFSIAY